MNTVSTLCATTTVGAAAVGYTFGLPPTPTTANTEHSWSPKRTSQYGTGRSGMATESHRYLPTNRYRVSNLDSRPPSTVLENSESRAGLAEESDQPLTFINVNKNRLGHDEKVPDLAGVRQEKTQQLGGIDHQPLSFLRRRSRPASWALSQSSSPRPSLHPGSVVPLILQETPITPAAPNKLVKRSMSLGKRSSSGPLLVRNRHWNEPSTSNQRSATFPRRGDRGETCSTNTPPLSDIPPPSPDLREIYRHYFNVAEDDTGKISRLPRKQQTADIGGIRRIQPRGSQQPVLLLGGLVAPASTESSQSWGKRSTELEVMKSRQRPSGGADTTSSPPADTGDDFVIDGQKRRSFSISDFLSGNLLSRKTPEEVKPPRRRLQRPLSRRITSAPIAGIQASQFNDDHMTSTTNGQLRTFSAGGLESSSNRKDQIRDLNKAYIGSGHHTPNDLGHDSPSLNSPSLQLRNRLLLPRQLPSPDPSSTSGGLTHATSRRSRLSETPSDLASSHLGSEADARIFTSGDEDDEDLRSDTVYDSMRTDVTRGSSTFADVLFHKDPSLEQEHSHSTLFHNSFFSNTPAIMKSHKDIIVEEDENIPTPVRTSRRSNPPMLPRQNSTNSTSQAELFSPPMLQPLSLGKLNWDSGTEEDEFAWSCDEEQSFTYKGGMIISGKENVPYCSSDSIHDGLAVGYDGSTQPASSKPFELSLEHDAKHSLFDWSEHFAVERTINNVPVRPKTVHGKKNRDGRGSRSNGRRAPSGPHARSQSVPVLPEQGQSRVGITSKFGTWGIGSKGATEDWDDDFDFPESRLHHAMGTEEGQDTNLGQLAIFVPQTIREQQTSVLANIDLLKEWGLLIEELKELRKKALILGLEPANFQATFDEVDAMIDLADQEAQDDGDSPLPFQPPASPDFRELETSPECGTSNSASTCASWQPSEEDDVFDVSQPNSQASFLPLSERATPMLTGRARKNSEAIARTVIQAVQRRRAPVDPTGTYLQLPPTSKVPFDKGTLRHILPHLTTLVKAMKAILRDAEGLSSSPKQQIKRPDPAFSQAFILPPPESPNARGRLPLRLERVGLRTTEGEDVDTW